MKTVNFKINDIPVCAKKETEKKIKMLFLFWFSKIAHYEKTELLCCGIISKIKRFDCDYKLDNETYHGVFQQFQHDLF
ncbi:hypothetical protein X975_20502, partial [Stegodyphus mimosarum]